MSNVPVRPRKRKGLVRREVSPGPVGVWVRLPEPVVEARAGLIPSKETDGNPPPDGLTSKELLAWHRGQPVFLSASRFVEFLGTAKPSTWRQALPIIVKIAPVRSHENRLSQTD